MTEASENPTTQPRVAVIVGSTRQRRVGRRVADALVEVLNRSGSAQIEVLDLAEVDLPYLDEPDLPAHGRYLLPTTRAWAERITGFDGFIIVTPEYNGGYPGVLKNALDTVWGEWNAKPFQIVAYGFHGGGSVAEQLRTVIGRLRGQLVEPLTTMIIGTAERDEAGDIRDASSVIAAYREQLTTAFDELVRQAPVRRG